MRAALAALLLASLAAAPAYAAQAPAATTPTAEAGTAAPVTARQLLEQRKSLLQEQQAERNALQDAYDAALEDAKKQADLTSTTGRRAYLQQRNAVRADYAKQQAELRRVHADELRLLAKEGMAAVRAARDARLGKKSDTDGNAAEPRVCPMIYAPVCATLPDGTQQTYPNSCMAQGSGATATTAGECAAR